MAINEEFRATQERMRRAQSILALAVSSAGLGHTDADTKSILDDLDRVGFRSELNRPLSLVEAFVFLLLCETTQRGALLTAVNEQIRKMRPAPEKCAHRECRAVAGGPPKTQCRDLAGEPLTQVALHFGLKWSGSAFTPVGAIGVGAATVSLDPNPSSRTALKAFLEAILDFKYPQRRAGREDDVLRRLQTNGAAVDARLKSVMDAWTLDMQAEFTRPMLERFQHNLPDRSKGVTLAGTTRMVVSSSIQASLAAKLQSFADATRPRPFSLDQLLNSTSLPGSGEKEVTITKEPELKDGKPVLDENGNVKYITKRSVSSSESTPLAGVPGLFAGMSPAAAIALQAAFNDAVEPIFRQIAPGIAVNIRPTVLADSASARLQIAMRFGVTTSLTERQTAQADIFRGAPPDVVEKHEVHTDAIISAHDMFDISSLSFQTSSPVSPRYVPILGRLPVIGRAFQFPRDNRQVHHASIILVNAAIVPRSLDLVNRHFQR
jgi:hypothetical protein